MTDLPTISARAALVCCLLPFLPVLVLAQQPGAGSPASVRETRITGVLLSGDQPQAGERVVLVKVRILDPIEGTELPELPSGGLAIIDADTRTPIATARTNASGWFEFRTQKPGPYSVGVTARSGGAWAAGEVTLLRRTQDTWTTLVFNISQGKDVDLGNVIPKEK